MKSLNPMNHRYLMKSQRRPKSHLILLQLLFNQPKLRNRSHSINIRFNLTDQMLKILTTHLQTIYINHQWKKISQRTTRLLSQSLPHSPPTTDRLQVINQPLQNRPINSPLTQKPSPRIPFQRFKVTSTQMNLGRV